MDQYNPNHPSGSINETVDGLDSTKESQTGSKGDCNPLPTTVCDASANRSIFFIHCAFCDIDLSEHSLESHLNWHFAYSPFRCKFCMAAYPDVSILEAHAKEREHSSFEFETVTQKHLDRCISFLKILFIELSRPNPVKYSIQKLSELALANLQKDIWTCPSLALHPFVHRFESSLKDAIAKQVGRDFECKLPQLDFTPKVKKEPKLSDIPEHLESEPEMMPSIDGSFSVHDLPIAASHAITAERKTSSCLSHSSKEELRDKSMISSAEMSPEVPEISASHNLDEDEQDFAGEENENVDYEQESIEALGVDEKLGRQISLPQQTRERGADEAIYLDVEMGTNDEATASAPVTPKPDSRSSNSSIKVRFAHKLAVDLLASFEQTKRINSQTEFMDCLKCQKCETFCEADSNSLEDHVTEFHYNPESRVDKKEEIMNGFKECFNVGSMVAKDSLQEVIKMEHFEQPMETGESDGYASDVSASFDTVPSLESSKAFCATLVSKYANYNLKDISVFCQICEERVFSCSAKALESHVATHFTFNPYGCKLCQAWEWRQKDLVLQHISQHHREIRISARVYIIDNWSQLLPEAERVFRDCFNEQSVAHLIPAPSLQPLVESARPEVTERRPSWTNVVESGGFGSGDVIEGKVTEQFSEAAQQLSQKVVDVVRRQNPHAPLVSLRIPCRLCGRAYSIGAASMSRHVPHHFPDDLLPFQCRICKKRFSRFGATYAHVKNVHDVKTSEEIHFNAISDIDKYLPQVSSIFQRCFNALDVVDKGNVNVSGFREPSSAYDTTPTTSSLQQGNRKSFSTPSVSPPKRKQPSASTPQATQRVNSSANEKPVDKVRSPGNFGVPLPLARTSGSRVTCDFCKTPVAENFMETHVWGHVAKDPSVGSPFACRNCTKGFSALAMMEKHVLQEHRTAMVGGGSVSDQYSDRRSELSAYFEPTWLKCFPERGYSK